MVSETLAQRAVAEGGLLTELANAYALLCWRGSAERAAARLGVDRSWAARHWSFDRRPACRKRVTRTADGRIVNELAAGGTAGRAPSIELGVIDHRLADEPLRRGPLLAFRALEALAPRTRRGSPRWWRTTRAGWSRRSAPTAQVDDEGVPLLRGEALDAIWTNVVEDRDAGGAWVAVDGEWAFRGVLPLDYLVWRAVKDLPLRFAREARGLDVVAVSGVAPDRVELFMELEDAFHAAAGTGPTPTPSARIAPYVFDAPPRFRILASADEIVAAPELLGSYAALFADAPATLVLVSSSDAAARAARAAGRAGRRRPRRVHPPRHAPGRRGRARDGDAILDHRRLGPARASRASARPTSPPSARWPARAPTRTRARTSRAAPGPLPGSASGRRRR